MAHLLKKPIFPVQDFRDFNEILADLLILAIVGVPSRSLLDIMIITL